MNADKYREVRHFVIEEIKQNELLRNKIEDSLLNEKWHPSEIIRTLGQRSKEFIEKASIQGWVEYYWDWDMKEERRIPLVHVNPIWISEDTKEIFLLDQAAKLEKGKPVFMLLRGIPFAIPMDFRIRDLSKKFQDLTKVTGDKRFVFGRTHLSTWDLYAKFKSLITLRVFQPPKITFKNMLILVITFILGCMSTYIVLSPYLFFGQGGQPNG